MSEIEKTQKHEEVSQYYGETLAHSGDLKTNACCTIQSYPAHIQTPLAMIHEEVIEKYYGCALTLPFELEGRRILDLGSGSGILAIAGESDLIKEYAGIDFISIK